MANRRIKLENLSNAIADLLQEERELVEKAIENATRATRTRVKKEVGIKSPYLERSRRHYRDDWSVKTEKSRVALYQHVTVYNKQYQLTHLLENGHFIFNQKGGPYGRTKAQPHIGPTQELADKMYEEELIKRLNEY